MARLIGHWKTRKKGGYSRTIQVLLGELTDNLDNYCEEHSTHKSAACRDLWELVLNQAVNINPIPLKKKGNDDGVVTVPVTEEMYQEIELFRGAVPRGAVLRALTVAGLKSIPEIHQNHTGSIPEISGIAEPEQERTVPAAWNL